MRGVTRQNVVACQRRTVPNCRRIGDARTRRSRRIRQKFTELGIDVYASAGTVENCKTGSRRHVKIVAALKTYQIGEFTVKAFDVVHDAAEPLGYIIEHPEMGRLLFATDTRFIRYNFRKQNLNHIMIEANYNDDILTARTISGDVLPTQAERVRQSHLSINQAGAFIAANVTPSLNNVVLVHLSSGNANREEFARFAAKTPRIRAFGLQIGI